MFIYLTYVSKSNVTKVQSTSRTREIPPSEGKIGTFCKRYNKIKVTEIFATLNCRKLHVHQWKMDIILYQTETWGFHPISSGQRKVASLTACFSMANLVAPLLTPKCTCRDMVTRAKSNAWISKTKSKGKYLWI